MVWPVVDLGVGSVVFLPLLRLFLKNIDDMNDSFIDLSEMEMLALWKQMLRVEPVRRECAVERDDGIDLDSYLVAHLQQWYARLLLTGPLEWLPVEDMSTKVNLMADADGVVTAMKPDGYVRAVEWMLGGWGHSVTQFLAPDDALALAQCSPWTRSGPCHPAIVEHDDRLLLYGIEPGTLPVLTMARCVAVPADGRYVMHRAALDTLPQLPV